MLKKGVGIDGMIIYLNDLAESFNTEGISPIELLVDFGKKLPKLSKDYETDNNRVPGCVSEVFIHAELKDNKVYFQGSSYSLVVGGYVKILNDALSGLTREEILKTEPYIKEFLVKTNLPNNLTPSRANALSNIYKLMIKKTNSFNPS